MLHCLTYQTTWPVCISIILITIEIVSISTKFSSDNDSSTYMSSVAQSTSPDATTDNQ